MQDVPLDGIIHNRGRFSLRSCKLSHKAVQCHMPAPAVDSACTALVHGREHRFHIRIPLCMWHAGIVCMNRAGTIQNELRMGFEGGGPCDLVSRSRPPVPLFARSEDRSNAYLHCLKSPGMWVWTVRAPEANDERRCHTLSDERGVDGEPQAASGQRDLAN